MQYMFVLRYYYIQTVTAVILNNDRHRCNLQQ